MFSGNKYPGYVGEMTYAGIFGRTVEFNKGNYIISLSVMADSSNQKDVYQKFDKFTSSFKVID